MSVERDYGADSTDAMRSRLEGLIGHSQGGSESHREKDFNGKALRRVMKERFTVEYDIQPTVRGKFVYLHIMWRYFEQLSFYMDEQQWDEHMEAVADLLKKWGAVDYFCDYINKVKKRRKLHFISGLILRLYDPFNRSSVVLCADTSRTLWSF